MFYFTPSGVCAQQIAFDVEDGKLKNVQFLGGCSGNGKGVAALAEGRDVDDLIGLLSNIQCGGKGTSCPAQLAEALRLVKEGAYKDEED